MATHTLHNIRHSSMDSTFLSAHEDDFPFKGAAKHTGAAPFVIAAHEDDKPVSPRHCLCSPTTHEGSFRCRLHRSSQLKWPKVVASDPKPEGVIPSTTHQWAKSLLPPQSPKWSAKIPPRPRGFSTSASKSIEAQ